MHPPRRPGSTRTHERVRPLRAGAALLPPSARPSAPTHSAARPRPSVHPSAPTGHAGLVGSLPPELLLLPHLALLDIRNTSMACSANATAATALALPPACRLPRGYAASPLRQRCTAGVLPVGNALTCSQHAYRNGSDGAAGAGVGAGLPASGSGVLLAGPAYWFYGPAAACVCSGLPPDAASGVAVASGVAPTLLDVGVGLPLASCEARLQEGAASPPAASHGAGLVSRVCA